MFETLQRRFLEKIQSAHENYVAPSMSLEQYKTYRQCMMTLHNNAVTWAMGLENLNKVAKKLRMLASDGTLIFEDEEDITYLSDALLYETSTDGVRTISAFFKKHPPSNLMETQFCEAMAKAKFGLYQVIATKPDQAEIRLQGMVAETQDVTFINVAMSETATPGMIFATRILNLPNLSISTGAAFPFEATKVKRLKREWWLKQGLERYVHFHKLFRHSSGIEYQTR